MVRNDVGKILGLFNAEFYLDRLVEQRGIEISDLALAGDVLVVEGSGKLRAVKLAEVVVSPNCYIL